MRWSTGRSILLASQWLAALTASVAIPFAVDPTAESQSQHIVGWAVAGVSLLVLGLAVVSLERAKRSYGTVYAIRMQPVGAADWHFSQLQELADKASSDLRVVQRQTPTGSDWTAPVEALAVDVQNACNTDLADTAFHLAPDLRWPAAVSLGSQIFADWQTTYLEELTPGNATKADQASRNNPPSDPTWDMRDPAVIKPWGGLGRRTTRQKAKPPPNEELPELHSAPFNNHDTDPVIVTMNLTVPNPNRDPATANRRPEGRFSHWYGVGVFPHTPGSDVDYRTIPRAVTCANPLPPAATPNGHTAHAHPYAMTQRAVEAIRTALHEHPTATAIYVTALVPKTVALAIGWHLLRDRISLTPRCKKPCCIDPWQRLVLLEFDQVNDRFEPRRVHPNQPSLDQQCAAWREVGTELHPKSVTGRVEP